MPRFFFLVAALLLGAPLAAAHDWYPGWCCSNQDCKPVRAWPTEEGKWKFVYDGAVYDVPEHTIQADETNKDPLRAHACVALGEDGVPYVRCFWRKGLGS